MEVTDAEREELNWLRYEVMLRFHPSHIPRFPNHTLGKIFGDIRSYEKRIDELVDALEQILTMAERSDAHPDLQFADIARQALNQSASKPSS